MPYNDALYSLVSAIPYFLLSLRHEWWVQGVCKWCGLVRWLQVTWSAAEWCGTALVRWLQVTCTAVLVASRVD